MQLALADVLSILIHVLLFDHQVNDIDSWTILIVAVTMTVM